MDRELPEESKKQRSRRRWRWIAVGISGIVLAVWLLRNSFGNSIDQKDVRLATAEVGDVENTLTASGEVQPDFEAVITLSLIHI